MAVTFFVGGKNKRGAKAILEEAQSTILEQESTIAEQGATIKGLQMSVGRLESKLAKQAEEIGALKAGSVKATPKKTTTKKQSPPPNFGQGKYTHGPQDVDK